MYGSTQCNVACSRESLSGTVLPSFLARCQEVRFKAPSEEEKNILSPKLCIPTQCILDTKKPTPTKTPSKAVKKDFCLCLLSRHDFSLLKTSSPTHISQLPSKTKKKWGIRDRCKPWRRVGVRGRAASPVDV